MKTTDFCVCVWSIAGFILCVCIPIILYGLYVFSLNKHKIPIKLRDPMLTILIVILFLIRAVGQSLFDGLNCDGNLSDTIMLIHDIITPALLLIGVTLMVLRFRIIHDKINKIYNISALAWKNLLTNNTDKKPWETNNNSNIFTIYIAYGVFGCIVQIIITLVLYEYNIPNNELYVELPLLPLLLDIIYMKCGYASSMVRDIYFVKWEEKYTALLGTFYLSTFGILNVSKIINGNGSDNIVTIIERMFLHALIFIQCILMTLGLCVKINKIVYKKKTDLANKEISSHPTITITQQKSNLDDFVFIETNINSTDNKKHNKPKYIDQHTIFKSILNDKDGIQYYCEHLFSEYTIENIVSFIEFRQWLNEYDNEIPNELSNNDELSDVNSNNNILLDMYLPKTGTLRGNLDSIKFEFSDEIPMSYINNNNEFGWFDKIKALNTKYISEYCALQINLPFDLRKRFERLIELYQFKLDNPNADQQFPDETTNKFNFENNLIVVDPNDTSFQRDFIDGELDPGFDTITALPTLKSPKKK